MEVHSHAVEAELCSDSRVGNALVNMYGKCDNIDEARLVFEGILEHDSFSWTMKIGGLAQQGRGMEAL